MEHLNSLYVIDREGKLIENYSKHFLYETDYKFCRKGKSFKTVNVKTKDGQEIKIGLGICMDLNEEDFKPTSDFELANFFIKENVDFISIIS
jgi:predicted amidohydrolase